MLDIKITGGQVVDGTGGPARAADVGIRGERIEAVEDLSAAEAKTVIDARGRIVCPGFIDAHSHSDAYLLIEPSAPSKIYQGVTTEVVGNCGASAAPLAGAYRLPSDWRDKPFPGEWRTVAEYRALLEQVRPAPNVVMLIGHNTVRAGVMGYENRAALDGELRKMKRLLKQALDEGGRGLSTGLIYPPGVFAERPELVELAKVAAECGGIYTSHMRSESGQLLAAIRETLSIGRAARIRVEISHLKTTGRANWGLLDEALDLIRAARDEGVDAAADRYPYTAGCTDLDIIFPAWVQAGGHDAALARLRDPADRARLRAALLTSLGDGWAGITIASTRHPENAGFQGVALAEVAQRLNLSPVDAVLHLAESDELRTTAFFHGMSDANMFRILAEPYVMIGSDASLRAPTGPLAADYPHPRAYGAFPRFLRMALDGKTVSFPEAVRKITSLPATHFRLKNRGLIAKHMQADLVVFDPRRLCDTATYADPRRFAEGIAEVIVNGMLTLSGGRLTGERAGRFLG